MSEFTGRRHRLNIPTFSASDDPAEMKRQMENMRRLMMDEFNRMSDDFYTFKKTTFESGVLPLKQVNNLAVVFDEYSMTATWELPQPEDIIPTHVRVRILEITPNEWAEYTYPKASWEFNGLEAGTQYTLQVQLIGRYEASDTFTSTTRNCPSVPVLRIAESAIKAKVFTTDAGVGPPTDPGLTDPEITFPFPSPPGTPAVVGPTGCHWEYGFQEEIIVESPFSATWTDMGSLTTFSGLVSSVTIDTSGAPFSTATGSTFRMKYRSICDGVPGGWVYTPSFGEQDLDGTALCGVFTDSASLTVAPFTTANLFAIPKPCHPIGEWFQIRDGISDNLVTTHGPAFAATSRVSDEWTIFTADTSSTGGYGVAATAALPLILDLNDTSDFTFHIDLYMHAYSSANVRGQQYDIMVVGNKIKVVAIFDTSTWSVLVIVPRDGGGSYQFRKSGLAYGVFNQIYYVHDVSEADGRKLYVNALLADTSTNAFENDFDGIDNSWTLYAVPLMRARMMYGWYESIADVPLGSALNITISSLSPKVYLPLDGPDPDALVDDGSVGADGTEVGTVIFDNIAGPVGTENYPTFGSGDFITVPDNNAFSAVQDRTIMFCWKTPSTLVNNQTAWLGDQDWSLYFRNSNLYLSVLNSGDTAFYAGYSSSFANHNANEWNTVIFTKEGDSTATAVPPEFYFNSSTATGTTEQPHFPSGTVTNGGHPLSIGAIANVPTSLWFDGAMAHVAVWDSILSASQIETLMDAAIADGWA